jgi:TolB-like protein/class 3 adenylate cyclase
VERRLAAILVTDVVGYSSLMEADEAGTHAILKQRRETIMQPAIARFGGRVVKLMGDGALIEFASAVNAVNCAVELQRAMLEANAAQSAGLNIVLRIGINLGDVIAEDGDLYGDGVNVAARLESLAEAGGICISDTVHRQIRGKIAQAFEDLGERELKNIAVPVRVYRVVTQEAATAARSPDLPVSAGKRTSIAVLPFDNMSGDPEQAYFSDGITEDIITELSKFRELQVTARNSSFQFRGQARDITDVAKRLGVAFVVEGSVRKAGNRVRVTAQLIDAGSGAHVWADRYDRELTDVFAIQDEISRAIAARVAGVSQSVLATRIRARPTNSLTAYDCYLRGRELFINYDTSFECIPFIDKAIELDPDFAIAHAMRSDTYCFQHGKDGRREHLDQAMESARRALALDPDEPWANYAMALVLTRFGRLGDAGHYHERSYMLNPNDAYMNAVYASWMIRMCRFDAALQKIDEALLRDPYAYDWFWDVRAAALALGGKYEEAVECFRRMRSTAQIPPLMYCFRAICHAELGDLAAAREAIAQCRRLDRSPEAVLGEETFDDPAVFERLKASLRKALVASEDVSASPKGPAP